MKHGEVLEVVAKGVAQAINIKGAPGRSTTAPDLSARPAAPQLHDQLANSASMTSIATAPRLSHPPSSHRDTNEPRHPQ